MSISILKGLHRRVFGISKDDQIVASAGYVAGGDGKPAIVFPAPDTVALHDDFLTDLSGTSAVDTGAAGLYFLAKCTDTGVKGALANATNGVFRITPTVTFTTATPTAASKSIVGKALNWRVNQGPNTSGRLRMGARFAATTYNVKPLTAGDVSGFFVGFTDTISHEVPFYDTGRGGDSGASAVSPASDAVGFLWGTGGDTGIRGVSTTSGSGGANDSGDQQVTLTTVKPTDNRYITLEVELTRSLGDTGGTAAFFIDGQLKGKISSPLNPTVALTPIVSWYSYDTGGTPNLFDIDWVNVSAPRDTGF
jgi:hypothetical protein